MKKYILFIFSLFIVGNSWAQSGKLFIIGGGKRPQPMIERLVSEAGISDKGYGIILPMSSSEPDSSIWYAKIQFSDLGLKNVVGMNFKKGDVPTRNQLDSITKASMIYISGGDQNRFMEIIEGTDIGEAIHMAYNHGSIIAGTSAGAAVMSEKMITGNELKHPEYSSTFRNIESDNIELKKGLGLITDVIIDQHFVKRSRYNRLISAVIEYPNHIGIGIDESTAILVTENNFEVIGDSQVIIFENQNEWKLEKNGLLGAKDLSIDILLPGQTYSIK